MNTKKELLLALLGESWAYLRIDGRAAGVDLPERLRGDSSVTLQIGYDMPLPIHDLKIDDEGVRATLSFNRTPHTCVIPWHAIYAISDGEGRGIPFPEDLPADLAATLAKAEVEAEAESEDEPESGDEPGAPQPDIRFARPATKPAPAPLPAPAPAAAEDRPAPVDRLKSGKPRPSHLKLV